MFMNNLNAPADLWAVDKNRVACTANCYRHRAEDFFRAHYRPGRHFDFNAPIFLNLSPQKLIRSRTRPFRNYCRLIYFNNDPPRPLYREDKFIRATINSNNLSSPFWAIRERFVFFPQKFRWPHFIRRGR